MKRKLLENEDIRVQLCKQYPVEYEYSPHPFRKSAISEAVNFDVDTGIDDESMCWVGYDWCGNAVGVADKIFIPLPNIIRMRRKTPAFRHGDIRRKT